jgi:hypothetical protein
MPAPRVAWPKTLFGKRCNAVSLDEFLAQKEAASAEFFNGKEPRLDGNMILSS